MITTCTVCQARYQLEAEKIPPKVIRVRCPSCQGVFSLDGTKAAAESVASAPVAPEPVQAPEPVATAAPEPVAPAPAPPAPAARAPEPEVKPAAAATGVAVMDEPETGARRRRSQEEMLARALVSDIKVYNKDLYETAKAEGNLLEALGGEIKKSWELYKEKVTPEVANSTEHFRDALNEILAEGQKIF